MLYSTVIHAKFLDDGHVSSQKIYARNERTDEICLFSRMLSFEQNSTGGVTMKPIFGGKIDDRIVLFEKNIDKLDVKVGDVLIINETSPGNERKDAPAPNLTERLIKFKDF